MPKPKKPVNDPVKEYIRRLASLGGKARARKYPKSTLRRWARLGDWPRGRPPKRRGH